MNCGINPILKSFDREILTRDACHACEGCYTHGFMAKKVLLVGLTGRDRSDRERGLLSQGSPNDGFLITHSTTAWPKLDRQSRVMFRLRVERIVEAETKLLIHPRDTPR
jgi:hypothetical protein